MKLSIIAMVEKKNDHHSITFGIDKFDLFQISKNLGKYWKTHSYRVLLSTRMRRRRFHHISSYDTHTLSIVIMI
jgi:glutamate formiminotransferase